MDAGDLALLLTAATAAGWVDAVVGGGGLLLLPALLIGVPQVPVATILGTNKMAAIAGTTSAAVLYARHTRIDWLVTGPAAGLAVIISGIGAYFAGIIPAGAYRPVVLGVLVAVALFVTFRPATGTVIHPEKRTRPRILIAVVTGGALIAAYDGLIGPGTGTFLVLAFTALIGVDFLHGSAMAKVVNAATNLGALVVFSLSGHVWWQLGAAMAICNIIGAQLGARLALRRGSGFVRIVLLCVVCALVARLSYDQWLA